MLDERAMEAALAEMNAALVPNASAIAKKYSLERTVQRSKSGFLVKLPQGQLISQSDDNALRQCKSVN